MRKNLLGLFWLLIIAAVDLLFMFALGLLWVLDGGCIFVSDRFGDLSRWIDRRFDELYGDW